ncbi:Acyl-CoA binding domain containing 3 [Balamuthia mandrillaris]
MDRVQKMVARQKEREEAMRKKEEERLRQEEEKKNQPLRPSQMINDQATGARAEQESAYQRELEQKRLAAEERRKREEEEIQRRAEERKAKLLAGEDISEDDWKTKADRERRQKEQENDKKWREIHAKANQNMKVAAANAEKKAAERGGSAGGAAAVDIPPEFKNMPEIPCIWGCKCTGFQPAAAEVRGTVPTCKICNHAKSMHHISSK